MIKQLLKNVVFGAIFVLLAVPAGTAVADEFSGGSFGDPYSGGSFDDPYSGGSFGDPYSGGSFDDPYSGGSFGDPYSGGSFGDPFSGGSFDDQFSGGSFGDPFSGGSFDDQFSGGSFGDCFSTCFDSCYYSCYTFDSCYYSCYTDEYGVVYSYSESFGGGYSPPGCTGCGGQSTPATPGCTSCGGSRSTPPISVRNPSYPQTPSYPPSHPPRPQPIPQQQQQQQQQQQAAAAHPININNVNTNTNVNNNLNTAPVTPVYQTPPQRFVQYVFPPQTVYPPVYPPPVYPPVQNLYCTITASPISVQNGQAAFLSWTSVGASSAWLSDGIGIVAPNGSLAVRPNVSTNYSLTVNGYGGSRTCTTYVNVSGTYVSLTQIPYTGFDLGVVGNAIYWAGLFSFALASAYLVLYYRGGTSMFARSMISGQARSMLGNIRLPKLSLQSAVPAPAIFANNALKAPAPAIASVRTMEDLPAFVASDATKAMVTAGRPVARSVDAPKDSMTLARSQNGEIPRIVVTRS